MSSLLEHVNRTIQTRRLFERGQPILVAVSGGMDSMVLLSVLHGLSKQQGWQLNVAHLNHLLRGRSSAADERLVRRTADRLDLPIVVERADVRAAARARKISVEMAARDLRHDFLARAAKQQHCSTIALAHHADDQVELFFLRLLRGSGPEGLAGMKWRSASPAGPVVALVRPMLDQPKAALLDYAREHKVRFREDASNASLNILRNRLRHELLPLLRRKYQPRLNDLALRVMDLIGGEAEAVALAVNDWLKRPTPFGELPTGVQRRCLQLQLLKHGLAPDFELIERLRLVPGRRISVRGGGARSALALETRPVDKSTFASPPKSAEHFCYRDAAGIVHVETAAKFNRRKTEVDLGTRSGRVAFAGLEFAWQVLKSSRALPRPTPSRELFDADLVGTPIVLRHWQPGDRFQPIGMGKPVKLQDLFTNEKIPRVRRHGLVVATTANGEIFWVEGLRISERFKLAGSTIHRLQWRWLSP